MTRRSGYVPPQPSPGATAPDIPERHRRHGERSGKFFPWRRSSAVTGRKNAGLGCITGNVTGHPLANPFTPWTPPVMAKSAKKRIHWRTGDRPAPGADGAVPPNAGWTRHGSGGRGLGRGEPAREKPSVQGATKKEADGSFSTDSARRPFRHAVFTSEAEYDQSVASVVARIRSGLVKARTPDK